MAHTINVAHDSTSKGSAISVVKSLVKFLEKVYGAVGEYVENANGSAKLLYFQDSSMKDIFNFFPDRVCIDVSYKKFEIHMYMYLFSCEDSNGRNHIIAVGFLNSNDAGSIIWLFDIFKKHNPNWRKIKMIAADPAIKPREVLRLFPQSLIVISFFHAKTTFKTDIDKINLTDEEEKQVSVELFSNLYTAQNQADFERNYQIFLALPGPVISYFQEMWMPTQNEWRIPLDYDHENIFLNLDLFLEELTNSVGVILAAENSSIEFIKKIFLLILFKKKEKSGLFLEPVSFLYSRFSPEHQISEALTPYAAKFVIEQLHLSSEIGTNVNSVAETYMFEHLGISVAASAISCTCNFYFFTLLPCRHIFAVRKINYSCLFDQSMISYMWDIKYYQRALTCMEGHLTVGTDKRIPGDFPSRVTLASHLFEVSQKPILESSKVVFESRLQLLKNMVQAWKLDDEVSVQFLGIEKASDKVFSIPNPSNLQSTSSSICSSMDVPSTSQEQISADRCNAHNTKNQHGYEEIINEGLRNFSSNILKVKHVNLTYIYCVICITKSACVTWLRQMGFIASAMKCPSCGKEMTSRNFSRLTDGVAWCCTKIGEKKNCSKRCSVRIGTWFESSNMALEQILLFCYMWINHFSKSQITAEIPGISASNYTFWDKFCLRVCRLSLRNSASATDDQIPSCSYTSHLDKWLEENEKEDTFIKFLTDGARVHNGDTMKSATTEDAEQ